jgi:hypothetical protein
MEDVGMFDGDTYVILYCHLVYFMAFGVFYGHWYISWPFGIFYGHLVYFSRFGMFYQKKSGNPDHDDEFTKAVETIEPALIDASISGLQSRKTKGQAKKNECKKKKNEKPETATQQK